MVRVMHMAPLRKALPQAVWPRSPIEPPLLASPSNALACAPSVAELDALCVAVDYASDDSSRTVRPSTQPALKRPIAKRAHASWQLPHRRKAVPPQAAPLNVSSALSTLRDSFVADWPDFAPFFDGENPLFDVLGAPALRHLQHAAEWLANPDGQRCLVRATRHLEEMKTSLRDWTRLRQRNFFLAHKQDLADNVVKSARPFVSPGVAAVLRGLVEEQIDVLLVQAAREEDEGEDLCRRVEAALVTMLNNARGARASTNSAVDLPRDVRMVLTRYESETSFLRLDANVAKMEAQMAQRAKRVSPD